MNVKDFEADFPHCRLIVYRCLVPSDAFPHGFEALIAIPRDRLESALANGVAPPFWKHGEVMLCRPDRGLVGVVPCAAPSRVA
jgi:hypothetical protein